MQKPLLMENGKAKRQAFKNNKFSENQILKEYESRKSAYRNTSIQTSENFFDDSDMVSDYFLIVIHDNYYNVPLLTARYYYHTTPIEKSLKGDDETCSKHNIGFDSIRNSKLFLSDRLSGNVNNTVYRRNRNYIFLLFYLEILSRHKDGQFILMARKEKHDKLLKKYIEIGLEIAGSNVHKSKEHWILIGDVKACKNKLHLPLLLKLSLLLKTIKYKIN